MEVKLLAFDLDGTIIKDDRKTITDKSIEAIKYAASKGVKIVIATGRMVSAIPAEIMNLDCIDYVVSTNGASLVDNKTGEVMYKSGLNYKKVDELAKLAERLGIFYELYCGGKSYAPKINKDNIDKFNIHEEFFDLLNDRTIPFESLEELENKVIEVDKFNMLSIPYDRYAEVWDAFAKIKGINQVSSIKINIEINSDETSKWNAIKELCNKINIDTNSVMTIGDSGNDYEMIKNAGLGVCMGNGFDEVKNASKYITKSIDEDGFEYALRKFI